MSREDTGLINIGVRRTFLYGAAALFMALTVIEYDWKLAAVTPLIRNMTYASVVWIEVVWTDLESQVFYIAGQWGQLWGNDGHRMSCPGPCVLTVK